MIDARAGQHNGVVVKAGEYRTPCLKNRLLVSGIIENPAR
jgi:hypothetical protein